MIKIEKEKQITNKKPKKPYYILRYNYMIGDADGNTKEDVQLSIENPFIERYFTLLNSLKPTEKNWGLILNRQTLYETLSEKQITKDDYNFLGSLMFETDIDGKKFPLEIDKKDEEYSNEFFEGVRDETEYSFLVFEGVELFHYDEFGKRSKTKIINKKRGQLIAAYSYRRLGIKVSLYKKVCERRIRSNK